MKTTHARFLTDFLFLLAVAPLASAGTLTGTVRNGTTGAVVPNQEVVLIQLQGGMQSVGTFKSDAQGRFTIEHPTIGQAPVLVRVQFRGVNYHQNVPPGQITADVEVFDSTANADALHIFQRIIAVQPNGAVLLVGEEFSVHNQSKPPVAVFREDGTFLFDLPQGAEIGQVSASGPSGLPLVQGTIAKGKNRYAIAFAMRPGENNVRVSYQLPYEKNAATIRASSPYAAQRVVIVAPPTMTISGAGFSPASSEQGWNLFARDSVAADTPFDFSVSGTAPPPTVETSQQGGEGTAASGTAVSVVPGRLDNLKWVLIGGLGALFGLGVIFLVKRPVPAPVRRIAPVRAAPAAVASAGATSTHAADVVAEVNRSVSKNIEEIKDILFRLELRKQAGTIGEEEYARERSRAEALLRDLLH